MKQAIKKKNNSSLRISIKNSSFNLASVFVACFIFILEMLILFGIDTIFFDEIIAIIGVLLILYGVFKKDNFSAWILILNILLFVVGLIPFLFNNYDRNFILKFLDFFLTFKFIYWFSGVYIFFKFFRKRIRFNKILNLHNKIAWILIICLAALESYSYFINGIDRVALSTGFNGSLATFILILQISNLLQGIYYKRNKLVPIIIFNLICIYDIFLTDSSTGMILSLVTFLAFFYFYFEIKFRFAIIILAILGAFFIYLYYDKIITYFFSKDTARSALYLNSIKISIMNFPFGIGLSLYGTAIAGQYYSPLYRDLNFPGIWGLEENGSFLNDAYYPGILGEFGIFGFLIFLILIFLIASIFYKRRHYRSLFFVFCLIVPILALNVSFNLANNNLMLLLFIILFLVFGKTYYAVGISKSNFKKLYGEGN